MFVDMYKNQLQELAQRSCFNLPSYSCIREGPDHAPRFKTTVNFNGETFESPTFCSTLRQAEHAAAEVALNTLANRGPSKALAARILDETGVYKNLLQETAHRAGLNLPVYTTIRSGPGHVPTFSCMVELGGMSFSGEPARTKKKAQKNAAMSAWSALRKLSRYGSSSSSPPALESQGREEQVQTVIARFLSSLQPSESKQCLQYDCQYRKSRSIPVCIDLTQSTPNLYSMQSQSWPYPFSPEISVPIYQIWQQEHLMQQQNHLFTFPVPPVPLPRPQILPYMQSILQPGCHPPFQVRDQESNVTTPRLGIDTSCPPLYLSNPSTSQPLMGRSTVTIQEIHEEIKEEASKYTPSDVVPSQSNVKTTVEEMKQDVRKQKYVKLESKVENDHRKSGAGSQHAVESNLRPHYSSRASYYRNSRPPSSEAVPMLIRTMSAVSSTRLNTQKPTLTQVPVPPRMRTGAPPFSTRPRFERTNLGGMRPTSMAPPVRIRSVVPVCSAPPPRKTPSFNQEKDKKDNVSEDVSTATSEVNKLSM
ncbi:hypothetical protein Goshw_003265 [Gossypium schwendimanii]|uniref:DRBM domain-containing protein n=1 Tax=Gossypium schwendimanii TaxID=34291 RepID=A0A7J9LKL0_GOSSC|nr:hypothetical protein [Gossypium schwendimanii]